MRKFGKFLLFCGFAFVVAINALVWIGSNEQSNVDRADVSDKVTVAENFETASIQPNIEPEQPLPSSAKPQRVDYDDLDDADKAIRFAINRKGFLCAKPIEVVTVDPSLYGVNCITNRDGTGRSNYLVNSRTGSVEPI